MSSEILGQGAFGSVYQITDLTTNTILALKTVNNAISSNVQKEADLLNLIRSSKSGGFGHPNIVLLKDSWHQESIFCLVFEYCNLGALNDEDRGYLDFGDKYNYERGFEDFKAPSSCKRKAAAKTKPGPKRACRSRK